MLEVFAWCRRWQGYESTSVFSSKTAELKVKIVECSNSVDLDEAAHDEPPDKDQQNNSL